MLTLLLALSLVSPQTGKPWVPADTMADQQDCGIDGHRHALKLEGKGGYLVIKEKGQPNIVMDGQCHTNDTDSVMKEHGPVLPVPKLKKAPN